MSTIELTLYNLLKNDFHLSEEKALEFIKAIEKNQKDSLNTSIKEYKSFVKEDFLRLELKMEQNKNDMFKWFLSGFITVVIMILGLFATIIFH